MRFFDTHRWLLSDPRFADEATRALAGAQRRLTSARTFSARERRQLTARTAVAKHQKLLRVGSRAAICTVFGRYCGEALRVARCESRLDTSARNGQYRGLFQMGSSERTLFGHGTTAFEQASSAHRYFIRTGRDWSPWTCKP